MSKYVNPIWFALLTACAAEPQPEPRLTPAAGTVSELDSEMRAYVSEFATVQCEYEARCGNIGPESTFVSETQCRDVWTRDTLFEPLCRAGLDSARAAACLSSIEKAPCRAPGSGMSRIQGCWAEDICARDRD
jgi:hypothetical protein